MGRSFCPSSTVLHEVVDVASIVPIFPVLTWQYLMDDFQFVTNGVNSGSDNASTHLTLSSSNSLNGFRYIYKCPDSILGFRCTEESDAGKLVSSRNFVVLKQIKNVLPLSKDILLNAMYI